MIIWKSEVNTAMWFNSNDNDKFDPTEIERISKGPFISNDIDYLSKKQNSYFGFSYILIANILSIIFAIIAFLVTLWLFSISDPVPSDLPIVIIISLLSAVIVYFIFDFLVSFYRNVAIIAKTNTQILNTLLEQKNKK